MQSRQNHIIFYCAIAMLVSLFFSRVALTVSIVLFAAACCLHGRTKEQLRIFFSSPLLWGMSLLFFLPLISGFWSDDRQEWINTLRVKLPLLVLPLAFASPFFFSSKQWRWLALIFIGLVGTGTLWSLFYYVSNFDAVNESYLRAKTMDTLLENDHVRFSWLVNISFLLAVGLWWQKREKRIYTMVLLPAAVWLAIFLHILAARTGLLCFYISLVIIVIAFAFQKTKRTYAMGMVAIVALLPVIAWFVLPTFRNKLKFFRYDFAYFKEAHYLPGGNDATRAISLKAGWNLMLDNSVKGTGFGDLFNETRNWYDIHYPQMEEKEKILPSNEWLIYGAACGIPGLLLFTCVLLIHFFTRVKHRWPWWLLNSLVAISFLFDIGLEVQFGIFIYAFIVLAAWKWLQPAGDY